MTESALLLPTCGLCCVGFFHFYFRAIYIASPRQYWGFALKPEFQKLIKFEGNREIDDL
ncbi:hypothetical protein [Vibrio parahaemolyticus]|uniref:hypothetical protein n=1 Tax=Vibrio parahaemolyticus TaxID=670 RepID=UPI0014956196|nr:hypothetical protein [Vibrio parahaemolyticus]